MIAAVVTVSGAHVVAVQLASADATTTTVAAAEANTTTAAAEGTTTAETVEGKDPSPLLVEVKELAWGLGSFLVLLGLMRFVLYPKLHAGMEARQARIAGDRAEAESVTTAARAEVAEYEAALAGVKAEAAAKVDAARQQVETQRAAAIAEANARIATQRSAAATDAEAAKTAVAGKFAEAAHDVVGAAAKMVLGRDVDAGAVQAAVQHAMSAGATR
jgi:F-type H+-transporting ATPase subunit b